MEMIVHTILFALLSPGLLLLVPSVFKGIMKNPLSFLAIFLNIVLFYYIMVNLKHIPYINTLEGFQTTTAATGAVINQQYVGELPIGPDGKPVTLACLSCSTKAYDFLRIGECEKQCSLDRGTKNECNECTSKGMAALMGQRCKTECPATAAAIAANRSTGS
jgi:hypothetical protein